MKRTRQERFRLGALFVLVSGFFLVVVVRLVHFQVLLHPRYSAIVEAQSSGRVSIPPVRGRIFDRNGSIVADNVTVSSLYAYPVSREEFKNISRYLERLFNLDKGAAQKKLALGLERFRWIRRQLDDELATTIKANAPQGLYLRDETRRLYPFGPVGKQILGFTDIDQLGLAGVEFSCDSVLAGQKGWADIRRDGLRNTFRVKESALVKPVAGRSLVLTVDWQLQEIVEQELQTGVDRYHAKSGMAVFLDCHNGDILAAAHFDPREASNGKPVKLRSVTDLFEPGSVLKAFTAAALLEAGLINFDDSIFCEEGRWKIGRRILHDDKKHGWMNFADVFKLSSNIGVAKCAIELGGDALYEALRSFGLGQKLGVGLPGEARGSLVRPQRWSDYTVAALAMGHSVSVTALQMATGFAAIANGGELVRPKTILGFVDENRFVPNGRTPDVIGRVMNAASADTLRALLRGVVEEGTGEAVNSPMVAIAGKTGTAEVPDLEKGGYLKHKFMASFAGFFPYEKPLIAGIVVLNQPEPIHYGGYTAGPVFRTIAERYVILKPDYFYDESRVLAEHSESAARTIEVPHFVGRDMVLAKAMADTRGIKLHSNAEEGNVVWQFPPADRLVFEGDEVLVAVEPEEKSTTFMADLKGLSIRQASAILQLAGIKFRVNGCGLVVKQSVRPGTEVSNKTVCQLTCRLQ